MIFDVLNPPATPDSDLDPDLSLEVGFTIEDNRTCMIAPGDWVDVDASYLPADPEWGSSHQVCNVYPWSMSIGVLIHLGGGFYYETTLDTSFVSNNFRRV